MKRQARMKICCSARKSQMRISLHQLLIITHDYHACKSTDIAKQLDFASFQVVGTQSNVLDPVYNESREVLAYTKWKLDELLLWLGGVRLGIPSLSNLLIWCCKVE